MKSSPTRPEPAPRVVLVADIGAPPDIVLSGDPYAALDDLLTVVEALCPSWPPREALKPMRDPRL